MMEIDKLVSMVTKQVKERLEAFENRKKVLMLGNCDNISFENLCGMFESNGFALCDTENYKNEPGIDSYEFVVITKSKFKELLQREKPEDNAAKLKDTPCSDTVKGCRIDKKIVTEQDIQKLIREDCRKIIVGRKTIITPLALDSAKVGSIKITRE